MKRYLLKNTGAWLRVSKKGNIRWGNRVLTKWKDDSGYPYIQVKLNGKRDSKRIHRILAELYIPNPNNLPFVNHKDGDKSNYELDNLEWSTEAENTQHAVRTGLMTNCTKRGESHMACKYSYELVTCIREVFTDCKVSVSQIAELFQMDRGFISRVVNLKTRIDA